MTYTAIKPLLYEDVLIFVRNYCITDPTLHYIGRVIEYGSTVRTLLQLDDMSPSFNRVEHHINRQPIQREKPEELYNWLVAPLVMAFYNYVNHNTFSISNKENNGFTNFSHIATQQPLNLAVEIAKLRPLLVFLDTMFASTKVFGSIWLMVNYFINECLRKPSNHAQAPFYKICLCDYQNFGFIVCDISDLNKLQTLLTSNTDIKYKISFNYTEAGFKKLLTTLQDILKAPEVYVKKQAFTNPLDQTDLNISIDNIIAKTLSTASFNLDKNNYIFPAKLPSLESMHFETLENFVWFNGIQLEFIPSALAITLMLMKSLSSMLQAPFQNLSNLQKHNRDLFETCWTSFCASFQVFFDLMQHFYKNNGRARMLKTEFLMALSQERERAKTNKLQRLAEELRQTSTTDLKQEQQQLSAQAAESICLFSRGNPFAAAIKTDIESNNTIELPTASLRNFYFLTITKQWIQPK